MRCTECLALDLGLGRGHLRVCGPRAWGVLPLCDEDWYRSRATEGHPLSKPHKTEPYSGPKQKRVFLK